MQPQLQQHDSPADALVALCDGLVPQPFLPRQYRVVQPDEMPDAYVGLLVHGEHMTKVLESYHGAPVRLDVLDHRLEGNAYRRLILLRPRGSEKVIEFGVLRLNLEVISPEVRAEILARKQPLGDILIRHDVLRRIEPLWYCRFDEGSPPTQYLAPSKNGMVFGRLGIIHYEGRPAIELLEVVTDAKES